MAAATVELLAPARDLACGLAAIDFGADAVYVGAERFGARAKAGNSLADIEALVRHAHTYWARVYVTVNTLLYDHELPQAVRLIHQLDEIGVDGVIIQDPGLLECRLPPIPLIASTQMHNHTPERVAFLEEVGFQRVILARELSLAQIRAIRARTAIELECFVHGTLCVCYSGQCYLSYAIGGRSGNRGACAQPCRRRYDLVDREGQLLVKGRHLLSLRDLNLSDHLADLIDAGVTAFKIEGRLKDKAYVANVVAAYRRQLDPVLEARGLHRSSSGRSRVDFTPNLAKTFNRGYTTYFLDAAGAGERSQVEPPGSIDTPKMVGELVGTVAAVDGRSFTLDDPAAALHNGDGLCFFDADGELCGTVVNRVQGRRVFPNKMAGIGAGLSIYRNHDHDFLAQLQKRRAERKIAVRLKLDETPEGLTLTAADEDGNAGIATLAIEKVSAENPEQAQANARKQLVRMGGTPFACSDVALAWQTPNPDEPRSIDSPEAPTPIASPQTQEQAGLGPYFVPLSALNALRRSALEWLTAARMESRPVLRRTIRPNDVPYPEERLTYLGNVLNRKAAAFYRRHGVTQIEPAAESGLDMRGRRVMRTRYCLKQQLGLCPKEGHPPTLEEPLFLVDEDGHRYELRFDCAACEMEVIF